jgi:hypothetical protein
VSQGKTLIVLDCALVAFDCIAVKSFLSVDIAKVVKSFTELWINFQGFLIVFNGFINGILFLRIKSKVVIGQIIVLIVFDGFIVIEEAIFMLL